jgi:hypothetical protein
MGVFEDDVEAGRDAHPELGRNAKHRLLRVPQRMPTREMLIGTLSRLENVQNIVVIVEDETAVWVMQEADCTLERINWMLDRAKHLIHGD